MLKRYILTARNKKEEQEERKELEQKLRNLLNFDTAWIAISTSRTSMFFYFYYHKLLTYVDNLDFSNCPNTLYLDEIMWKCFEEVQRDWKDEFEGDENKKRELEEKMRRIYPNRYIEETFLQYCNKN